VLVRLRSTKARAQKSALGLGAVLVVLGLTVDPRANFAKPVYYLLAVTLATTIVLNFTVVGRRLRAASSNVEAARLLGINVTRYKVVPFMLNGLAAAVVGILFSARLSAVSPAAMSGMELTVISAAILGGTSLFGGQGSIIKSVAVALVLFSLLNGFNLLNLGATLQGLIEGIAIIVAAAIYRIGRPAR
jgi:D-xylose transport system permease protein